MSGCVEPGAVDALAPGPLVGARPKTGKSHVVTSFTRMTCRRAERTEIRSGRRAGDQAALSAAGIRGEPCTLRVRFGIEDLLASPGVRRASSPAPNGRSNELHPVSRETWWRGQSASAWAFAQR